ncbi:hypothetical protein EON65_51380 [archaeon]|nr:MAG: hypothetical protein EON65_51380 [archaeon]
MYGLPFAQGEWVENNREGYGVMLNPSGNIYEGEWKGDRKAGYGTMIWKEVDEVGRNRVYFNWLL